MELETHLIISEDLGYVSSEALPVLRSETREMGKMLKGLISALRARRSNS